MRTKKLLYSLLISVILVPLLWWSRHFEVMQRMELSFYSWTARTLAEPSGHTGEIKLVLLDQASLDWASKELQLAWPWPREVYAAILDFLTRAGARSVTFDVLFTEPSEHPEQDEIFADAIKRAGNVVIPVFLGGQAIQTTIWPEELPAQNKPVEMWTSMFQQDSLIHHTTETAAAFPVPEIAAASHILANVKEEPDIDGEFRRVSLFRLFDGHVIPSLGLAAYLAGEVESLSETSMTEAMEQKALHRMMCLNRDCNILLRFCGPSGTHEAFSAAAVLQSELKMQAGEDPGIPLDAFKDKYVIFGFSAPGLKDLRPSPMGGDYPGCEIYATMLDNILSGRYIRTAPAGFNVAWVAFLVLLVSVSIIFSKHGWQTLVVIIMGLALPFGMTFFTYENLSLVPLALPLVGVLAAIIAAAVLSFVLEGRQKMFIKSTFRHYLSKDVIEEVLKNPEKLKLGGERRELTIFFSDLQGFSSISEKLEPEALTGLLNSYLTDMTNIIMEEGGTLDKYEGDAIIAFWNAPLDQPDHALRAVRAAIRCQHKLDERQAELAAIAGGPVKMRIGLNTGFVIVGNMGSQNRFDYTVLGDAANLASRLEGANKALGTYLMISESTWSRLDGQIPGRELGTLRVVGRNAPVRVFEAIALSGDISTVWKTFEEALTAVREERWQAAADQFATLPDDPPAVHYARRCRQALESGETWDGIWNLTEK